MASKKSAKTEPAEKNETDVVETSPQQEVAPVEKPMSKMDMVRAAMRDLGDNAKPMAIQKYLQEQFHTHMDTGMISSYKSHIKTKEASQSGLMRKVKSSAPDVGGSTGVSVEDIYAIRHLINKHGARDLKRLVDILAS